MRRVRTGLTKARIVVRLNDRLRDDDRRGLFEQPLDAFLHEYRFGAVLSGRAQLAENSEVAFSEIDIGLHESPDNAVAVLKESLEQLGAPRGSLLLLPISGREIPVGTAEGLAIYLKTRGLPAEVYENSDINFLFEEINRMVAPQARIHSYWEGPGETALYVYGKAFTVMQSRLAELLASYPLCREARVERIA